MTLDAYADKFSRLLVNSRHGRASPHKICMLLAVLDLARGGGLQENRIVYGPPLLERYRRFRRLTELVLGMVKASRRQELEDEAEVNPGAAWS